MQYEDINEYIKKSKDERTAHLDLSDSCIEIGGCSSQFRGILSHCLKTTIPVGMKIHLCHGCHNGKCSNPKHLYWGNPKENFRDALESGARKHINEYIKIKERW